MQELIAHQETINRQLARYGVKFGIYKNGEFKERLFPFDPLPRVIPAAEFAVLDALCHAVHSLLRYQPGATGIYTTAEEALAGGRGVCQDYAHVFIALARLAGWHARYCMGLTVGEGATHAWAEIYYEGAWHGFDPTRDCRTDASYLRFATGRDAADCPVEQGTFYGLADQTQTVFMRVKEI